jgi:hypothetical protein
MQISSQTFYSYFGSSVGLTLPDKSIILSATILPGDYIKISYLHENLYSSATRLFDFIVLEENMVNNEVSDYKYLCSVEKDIGYGNTITKYIFYNPVYSEQELTMINRSKTIKQILGNSI